MKRVHNKYLVVLFLVVFIVSTAGTSFSQLPNMGEADDSIDAHNELEIPESRIEITKNMLTVELHDADLKTVIESIGKKSGFTVEIYSDVSQKKLTTKFSQLDLERGLVRLLMLTNVKNYLIQYDTKGMVSSLEIYRDTTAKSKSSPSKARKTPRTRSRRPVYRPTTAKPPVSQNKPPYSRSSSPRSRSSTKPVQPSSPITVLPSPQKPAQPSVQKPVQPTTQKQETQDEKKVITEVIHDGTKKGTSGEVMGSSSGEEINEVKEIPLNTSEKMKTYKKHMVLPPNNQ